MGYETELIFFQDSESKDNGYRTILARLEMGKVCNDEVGKLIQNLEDKNKKRKGKELIKELLEINNQINNGVDEFKFSDEEMQGLKKLQNEQSKIEKQLEQKGFIYVYCEDGNTQIFDDKYNEPLLITNLEELETAIRLDNAKMINGKDYERKGYRRFTIALKMIEEFKDKELWNDVKVILFGH